ncbi:hypothetical protein K8I31_18570, partial [bacterium]|nr:hypothetical protein [bacterium]
ICTDVSRPALEYYLSPHGFIFTSYPPDMNNQLAHYNADWYSENLNLDHEANQTIQTAKQLMKTGASLWVISYPSSVNYHLEKSLQSDAGLFGSPTPIQAPRIGIRMPATRMYIFRYEQR